MSIIAPAGIADSAFDPHELSEEPAEREDDPVADYLRERGIEDPEFLGRVTHDLRRYHDWYRGIVLPAAQKHGSQVIHIVPEFAADNDVRHGVGNPKLTEGQQLRIDQLMRKHSAVNYPQGEFLPGRPIASPVNIAREEYMNGRIHRGTCHICGKEELLQGQIQLYSGEFRDRIEAIRVDVGECDVSLLETNDWDRVLEAIYTKGALYPRGHRKQW